MRGEATAAPATVALIAVETDELQDVADRIRARDRHLQDGLLTCSLENGLDLLEVKGRLGHGHFEKWCKAELNYSKSKAEKLMRAAEMVGPHLKSRTLTDLKCGPTVLYELSAPSVPQGLKDAYLPRILAGERVGPELRQAIKAVRENENRAAGSSVERVAGHEGTGNEKAAQKPSDVTLEQDLPAQSRRRAAQVAAVAFIIERIGNDLLAFMALFEKAGAGGVFVQGAEREFELRTAQTFTELAAVKDNRPAEFTSAESNHDGFVASDSSRSTAARQGKWDIHKNAASIHAQRMAQLKGRSAANPRK